jgi:hypothetical protein
MVAPSAKSFGRKEQHPMAENSTTAATSTWTLGSKITVGIVGILTAVMLVVLYMPHS